MTKKGMRELVRDMRKEIDGYGEVFGSGYYDIKELKIYDEDEDKYIQLNIYIQLNKAKFYDNQCYFIAYGANIDGGDNICDRDYEYTNSLKVSEVYELIESILKHFDEETLKDLYYTYLGRKRKEIKNENI